MGKESNLITNNRKVRHDYQIEQTFEAGIALAGWEVKSLRDGKAQISESHVLIRGGEAFLLNAHIAPLKTVSTHIIAIPDRTRKLLLNKKDLDKLFGQKYARVSTKKEVQIKQEKTILLEKPQDAKKETFTQAIQEPKVSAPKPSNVLIPPTIIQQQLTQNIPNDQPVQIQKISQPKKEISWTAIIIIGLILFTVIDVVLLIFYLTSSQPLASPVP